MPPVWHIFCWLTGVPGIINILRTRSYLPNNKVIEILIGGIITAFSMPKVALVSEINDRKNDEKK